MRKMFDLYNYLKYSVYEATSFFNFTIYIFGNEKIIQAIMFDSYHEKSVWDRIINSTHKGLTPIIEETIHFFRQYEKGIYELPPPCDLSLYTKNEQKVLHELLLIRPGSTISYSELAIRCGLPGAARFVGNVMAKNLFPVVFPCHRVMRSNGNVGYYSGGVGIKEFLLEFEKINRL